MSRVVEKTYDFTFTLSGVADFTDAMMDRLFEAGCDDTSFGFRGGVPFAIFHREAGSYEEALASARASIAAAGIGLTVVAVEPR